MHTHIYLFNAYRTLEGYIPNLRANIPSKEENGIKVKGKYRKPSFYFVNLIYYYIAKKKLEQQPVLPLK